MCTLFNNQQHSRATDSGVWFAQQRFRPCSSSKGRDGLPGVYYTAVPACSELPCLKSTHPKSRNFITEALLTRLCGSPVDQEQTLHSSFWLWSTKGFNYTMKNLTSTDCIRVVHRQLLWEVKSYEHHRDSPLLIPLICLFLHLISMSYHWESHFLGRLIRSLGVPKEQGVWNSQEGRKDKPFFPSLHSLGLYNNNVSCLRTVSGLNPLANSVILKCKLWE